MTGLRRSIDPAAAVPQDAPEWSSIADDRRQQHPVNLKPALALTAWRDLEQCGG